MHKTAEEDQVFCFVLRVYTRNTMLFLKNKLITPLMFNVYWVWKSEFSQLFQDKGYSFIFNTAAELLSYFLVPSNQKKKVWTYSPFADFSLDFSLPSSGFYCEESGAYVSRINAMRVSK